MIELPVVPISVAKDLKESGFNEYCHRNYTSISSRKVVTSNNSMLNEFEYSAPTQAFACMWFREVHNVSIEVNYTYKGYTVLIYDTEANELWVQIPNTFPSHAKAELKGIEESLNLLKP